jgi:peptide/nickel transport system permease protein
MPTRSIVVKKIVNLVLVLFAIWTLNFFLFHMLPGDPTYALLPARVDPAIIEDMRHKFGLDKPLLEQYFISLLTTLKGDFGYSWFYKKPVLEVVSYRIQYTLLLAGTGTILSVLIGTYLGVVAGSNRGRATDTAIVATSLSFYAMPAFWLGMVLLMVLAGQLKLFPLRGFEDVSATQRPFIEVLGDRIWHMILPVLTFVLTTISEFVLMMRNTLVDVLTEDYVTTARAKGLGQKAIVWRHAVPNALLPTAATTAMYIGWIVTGAIMIEVVFSWPGIGSLTWEALQKRDFPVLQCIFLVVTLAMLLANFLADIIYTYLDPRVRM